MHRDRFSRSSTLPALVVITRGPCPTAIGHQRLTALSASADPFACFELDRSCNADRTDDRSGPCIGSAGYEQMDWADRGGADDLTQSPVYCHQGESAASCRDG